LITPADRIERLAQDVLDTCVAAFAGWTLGYQAGFLLTLPAVACAVMGLTLALLAVLLLLRWRRRQPTLKRSHHALPALAIVLAMCLAVAVLSTLTNRPDADDITFFPRVAAQLSHLGQPIFVTDVTSDVPDLPGASIGYLLTSYEFLAALAAKVLHLNPLSTYHNAAGAVGAALVPLVYYLLLRRLGLTPLLALAGAGGAIAFLLLDGNDHRAMGNLAFVRSWQGKAILLTLLPPYILTHTVAFLSAGGRRPWLCVVFAGLAATGLSTIGCFFAPGVIGVSVVAVGAALLATGGIPWQTLLKRAALLLLGVLWPLFALATTLVAPVPGTYSPLDIYRLVRTHPEEPLSVSGPPPGWFESLILPAGTTARAIWALALVALAPFLSLPRRQALLVAFLVPAFLLLVGNPLSGPLLYSGIPDVFWRFSFFLPVALCAGLLVTAIADTFAGPMPPDRIRLLRGCLAAGLIALFAFTVTTTTLSPDNYGFSWKRPTEWKLDRSASASVGPWLTQLSGRRVLADEATAVALCLMDPEGRALVQRPACTLQSFGLADRFDQGLQRVGAQRVAAGTSDAPKDLTAFRTVVASEADAVIVRKSAEALVRDLLKQDGATWSRGGSDGSYTLFLRDPTL
jgi:hypothetical protein